MRIIKVLPLIFLLTSCYGWGYAEQGEDYIPYDNNEEVYDENYGEINDYDGQETPDKDENSNIQDENEVPDQTISDDEYFEDEIEEIDNGLRRISVGSTFACSIKNDKVLCWGRRPWEDYSSYSFVPTEIDLLGVVDDEKPISVSVGEVHVCVVFDNGRLVCWGSNSSGQLGTGTVGNFSFPVEVDVSGNKVRSVSCGSYHTCAVTDDREVFCWGRNSQGQLGRNDSDGYLIPGKVGSEVFDEDMVEFIDAGDDFTCAITKLGKVYCWGGISFGTNIKDKNAPFSVGSEWGLDKRKVVTLDCGEDHICVIDSYYRIFCLGSENNFGELGVNRTDINFAEVNKLGYLQDIKTVLISSGSYFSCAADKEGKAFCWGMNSSCQLGTGSESQKDYAKPVDSDEKFSGSGIQGLSSGDRSSCVMNGGGNVYCWGSNYDYTLGNGTRMDKSCIPVAYAEDCSISDRKIISVDASIYRTCAVEESGSIYCWGMNSGINDPDEFPDSSLVPIKQIRHDGDHWEGVEKMSMGRYHACALLDDGFIYCWGENSKGQLGNESITDSYSSTLVYKSGDLQGAEIVDISLGSNHSCALDVDGSVYCWGFNMFGQIGDGTLKNSLTPKKIFDGDLEGEKVVKLSSGSNHVCVITDKNAVYCWGQNERGQLGNGTYENATAPVKIDDSGVLVGKKIVDISSLSGHVCALDDIGDIYCWGENDSGQLGDGTQENRTVPVAIQNKNSLKFDMIAAGWGNTCAVEKNNDLYCWGKDQSLKPIKIDKGEASDTQIVKIDAGQSYVCFINNFGTVYCWGENSKGELGDGTATYRDLPVRVY